jgi:uncharacterized protein YybS (DUF2232 family)
MLVMLLTPLSIFVVHFLLVPLVILFSKYRFGQTVLPFLVVLAVYSVIHLSLGTIMFISTLFLLLPTLIMGKMNREQKHGGQVIFSGFAVILTQILVLMLILLEFYDINVLNLIYEQMKVTFNQVISFYAQVLPAIRIEAEVWKLFDLIKLLTTTFILFFSVYFAYVTYMLSKWMLTKQNVQLPELLPIREWKLPRSLIWLNLFALLLGLFIDDRTSYFYALHLNLFVILFIVFWVQGIGFLFYLSHHKRWGKALPIVGICASVFSPILYLFSIVGLIDMLFPIRKRMIER